MLIRKCDGPVRKIRIYDQDIIMPIKGMGKSELISMGKNTWRVCAKLSAENKKLKSAVDFASSQMKAKNIFDMKRELKALKKLIESKSQEQIKYEQLVKEADKPLATFDLNQFNVQLVIGALFEFCVSNQMTIEELSIILACFSKKYITIKDGIAVSGKKKSWVYARMESLKEKGYLTRLAAEESHSRFIYSVTGICRGKIKLLFSALRSKSLEFKH